MMSHTRTGATTVAAVDQLCQMAWDCFPKALAAAGLSGGPAVTAATKAAGKSPLWSLFPAPLADASADDSDCVSERSFDGSFSELHDLADLLTLPTPVTPVFAKLGLNPDAGTTPATPPGLDLGGMAWGDVEDEAEDEDEDTGTMALPAVVITVQDEHGMVETNPETEDNEDDEPAEAEACWRPIPRRRRLVSVFNVADRWGLDPDDAAELMDNFERAQSAPPAPASEVYGESDQL